jgi:putative sterol carrier protein
MTKKEEIMAKITQGAAQGRDLLLLLEVIKEIAATNSDLQELLNDLKEEGEPIKIAIEVDQYKGSLVIENGTVNFERGLVPNPTVHANMTEETARAIMSKKLPMQKAFTEGKVKLVGNLGKAAALLLMLNVVNDELGLM